MRSHLSAVALVVLLLVPATPQRAAVAVAAPVQGGPVRIVGPRGEATPVVNENNQLQLHVEGAGSASRWASDSPEVATVSNAGVLSGKRYGFATIAAEAGGVTAQVIVVVVRKTPRRASRAPLALAIDGRGDIFVSEKYGNCIRRIDAATGTIQTVVGTGDLDYGGDDGPASMARLYYPPGVAFDVAGNLYISDVNHNAVRSVRSLGAPDSAAGPR